MASKTLPALLCGGFVAATVASTCYVFVTFGTYCFASSPQTLQTLASVAPGLGDVHLKLGTAWLDDKKPDKAKEVAAKLMARKNDSPEGHALLMKIACYEKDFATAIVEFSKTDKSHQDELREQEIECFLGQDDAKTALQRIELAMDVGLPTKKLWELKAQAYAKLGESDKAKEAEQQAKALD